MDVFFFDSKSNLEMITQKQLTFASFQLNAFENLYSFCTFAFDRIDSL